MTNYSTDPNHGFTTKTSQFDDELLKRNIITFEQAMMAKGASPEEAQRLKQMKKEQDEAAKNPHPPRGEYTAKTQKHKHQSEEDDNNEDALLEEYRTRRRIQLQHGNSVIPISRTDWNQQVNEASLKQWVVILLTSTSSAPNLHPYHLEICHKVERIIIPHLASKFDEVKWVSIPSKNAIENWPDDNLPTLFCYKRGMLQCQLVGLEEFGCGTGSGPINNGVTEDGVEYRLGKMGVLDTDIDVDPNSATARNEMRKQGTSRTSVVGTNMSHDRNAHANANDYGRSKFQGGMATFATNDEDLSDYDDVD